MTVEKTTNKSKFIIIAFVLILVVMASVFFTSGANSGKSQAENNVTQVANQVTSTNYIDYNSDTFAKASQNDVVLFFKASWCPTCNATDKDITTNLSKIPQNLIIAKADYDKEVSLKQKYGVVMQHTFVKVDKYGNEIKKANGLNTLNDIVNFAKVETSAMKTNNSNTSNSTSNPALIQAPDSSSAMNNETENLAPAAASNSVGVYSNYSNDSISKASTDNVVLFFNASWCPTCKSTVKNIDANLDKIPSNLTILSVDYDKETALRQKYGITYQHTFVKIDKEGNLIKKENGLSTLENIVAFSN